MDKLTKADGEPDYDAIVDSAFAFNDLKKKILPLLNLGADIEVFGYMDKEEGCFKAVVEQVWESDGLNVQGLTDPCECRHETEADAYACRWMNALSSELSKEIQRWRMTEFAVARLDREPAVKFYKDRGQGGNGSFATSTTADDPETFLAAVAEWLPHVLQLTAGDEQFTLEHVLPQICELWAKLKGYKADRVFEERLLVIGQPHPERSMDYLNRELLSAEVNGATT
jgi:hypothetical protein